MELGHFITWCRRASVCCRWQNTRLPYGAMLTAGDFDTMEVILDYYANIEILLSQRTELYWGHPGEWQSCLMSTTCPAVVTVYWLFQMCVHVRMSCRLFRVPYCAYVGLMDVLVSLKTWVCAVLFSSWCAGMWTTETHHLSGAVMGTVPSVARPCLLLLLCRFATFDSVVVVLWMVVSHWLVDWSAQQGHTLLRIMAAPGLRTIQLTWRPLGGCTWTRWGRVLSGQRDAFLTILSLGGLDSGRSVV